MHSIHSVLHLFILLTYTQQMTPKFHPFLKNTPIYMLTEYHMQRMNIIKKISGIITYKYSLYSVDIQHNKPFPIFAETNRSIVKKEIIWLLSAILVQIVVLLYNIYLCSSIYHKHTFNIRRFPIKPYSLCAPSIQHGYKNAISE